MNESPTFPKDKNKLNIKDITDSLEHPLLFSDEEEEESENLIQLLKSLDKAVRPPPTGAEQLIANELAVAIVSKSMEKIRHICEAWMILSDEEIEQLGMSATYPKIKRTYALVNAFTHYSEDFEYDEYGNPLEMIRLGLPFTEDEAYSYLHPWATRLPFESFPTPGRLGTTQIEQLNSQYFEYFQTALNALEYGEKSDENLEYMVNQYKAKYIYWSMRDGLTKETFKAYVSAFITEHTPLAMQWFKKLMGKISPSSFKEAVASLGAKVR